MQEIDGAFVWGEPVDEGALKQIRNCAKSDAVHCAMMADHHKGYAVPIGGVVAYTDKISPSGVGYDIACGNKAVRLDIPAGEVRRKIKTIMDDVWANLEFGMGRRNETRVDHDLFDDDAWGVGPMRQFKDTARNQLGTIGSGNHYVDLFADEQDRTWVGVHFGSRGLGHKTATHFLKAGGAVDGMDADPLVLDADSGLGSEYIACMNLAGCYAYAGRDWVCGEVARLLGADDSGGNPQSPQFCVARDARGAGPLGGPEGRDTRVPRSEGFVGGSMGDNSVILEGVESDEGGAALYSTVHGAGRVMSRTRARGKINYKTGKVVAPGEISREMMMDWVHGAGVELRGAGTDESPQCYKRLPEVLGYHAKSVRVLHTLTPLGRGDGRRKRG